MSKIISVCSFSLLFSAQVFAVDIMDVLESPNCLNPQVSCNEVNLAPKSCMQDLCKNLSQPFINVNQSMTEIMDTPEPLSADQVKKIEDVFKRISDSVTSYKDAFAAKPLAVLVDDLQSRPEEYCKTLTELKHYTLVPDGSQDGKFAIVYDPQINTNEVSNSVQFIAERMKISTEKDPFRNIMWNNISIDHAKKAATDYFNQHMTKLDTSAQSYLRSQVEKMNSASTYLDFLNAFYQTNENSYIATIKMKPSLCQCDGCASHLASIVASMDISKKLSVSGTKEILDDLRTNRKVGCQMVTWATKKMTPSDEERKAFAESVEVLQKNYSENIFKKLSEESRAKLEDRPFREIVQGLDLNKDIAPDFDEIESKVSGMTLASASSLGHILDRVNGLEDLSSMLACNTSPMRASDAYDPNEDVIHFSPYSVKRNDRFILGHELGHWLSEKFSSHKLSTPSGVKYGAFRSCVTKSQGNELSLDTNGDSSWTEEDAADQIAAPVNESSKRSLCNLNSIFGDSEELTAPTSVKAKITESHSPIIWRILSASAVRGEEIPATCMQALAEIKAIAPGNCTDVWK